MMTENYLSLEKVGWWVRLYSYITAGAIIYGLAAAHVPFIIGTSWSFCEVCGNKLGCVLALHLYEAPLTIFNGYVAWYGLKRFSQNKAHNFMSLLTITIVANIAFFTFECQLIVDILRREAPLWESLVTSSLALLFIGGAGFAVFVKQKLVTFVNQENQS